MLRYAVFFVFAVTMQAATHRVCWSLDASPGVHCGEPLGRKVAEAFVTQSRQEFPNIHYWIATDPARADWKRARWAVTGIALAAGVYDAHTTTQVLNAGGVEKNALFGPHPSALILYGSNVAAIAGQWVLMDWWRLRGSRNLDRNIFLTNLGSIAVHTGAGLHNRSVLEQQRRMR